MLNFQMQRGINVKLPEVLKMAVESGDWELVCQAYTGVTGLPLSPPKPKDDWANTDIQLHSDGLPPECLPGGSIYESLHSNQSPLHNTDVSSSYHPDFDDNTEPIIDENIAKGLVQDEGNNIGEYDDSDGEAPFANDEAKQSFIASSKSGKPQQNTPNARGETPATKQKMLIPEERTNRFEDNLDALVNERVDLNPKMGVPSVSARVARGKEQVHMIEVVCAVCSNIETISGALAIGYSKNSEDNIYKCNGCITGRRKLRE